MDNLLDLKRYKILILIGLFVLSCILIGLYFSPTTDGFFDETYTMTLIHHSYSNIIYYDSMDVHPFLYYFLVKFFINITTFWTSSIIIKLMSARLFSLICSIITFLFLRGIISNLHIKNNIIIEWLLFLILPGVLNPFIMGCYGIPQLIDIRMYSLATLFISAEFYCLLKYSTKRSNIYLYLTLLSAVLASYTHYYAALFGGTLIMVYGIMYFIHHDNTYKKFIMLDITLVICFMPWLLVFLKQLTNPNTYWMTNNKVILEIIKFIVLITLFFYPLHKYRMTSKNHIFSSQLFIIYITLIPVVVLIAAFSFISHPIFVCRYMFPIFIIYEFISINIAFKNILKFHTNNKLIYYGIFMVLIIFSIKGFLVHQIPLDINTPRISSVYSYQKTEYLNKRDVYNSIYDQSVIISMLPNHKILIIPKHYENKFKSNSHIFYNSTYKLLFKNEIKRIKFK